MIPFTRPKHTGISSSNIPTIKIKNLRHSFNNGSYYQTIKCDGSYSIYVWFLSKLSWKQTNKQKSNIVFFISIHFNRYMNKWTKQTITSSDILGIPRQQPSVNWLDLQKYKQAFHSISLSPMIILGMENFTCFYMVVKMKFARKAKYRHI